MGNQYRIQILPWEVILFNFYKERANELHIKLNDTPIANKKTVKMLGVLFDKRQTWSPYIKHLKKKPQEAH